jgi:hypothetical protein
VIEITFEKLCLKIAVGPEEVNQRTGFSDLAHVHVTPVEPP